MSTIALLLAFLLAAQVQTKDRYGATGVAPASDNAASTADAASTKSSNGNAAGGAATNSNAAGSGLIPRLSPPPAVGQSGDAAPASSVESDAGVAPYVRSQAPPVRGQETRAQQGSQPPPPFESIGTGNTAAAPVARPKPSSIMKQMMTPPPGSQLAGTPATLIEVVSGARSRQEQSQRIEAYWDLCSSVADYYLGVLEQGEMQTLRTKVPRAGAAMQQAEAKFAVRLGTSKQAAVASQRRLASMLGQVGSLPLPADLPHCGSYQSRYEEIFAGQPHVEAQDLALLLPMRYAELKEYAAAVVQTRASLDMIASNDNGDGTTTLRALELLALERRAFVQLARDYNRRIARYAELSTPGEIGAERLVGLLIKRDNTPTATRPALPSSPGRRQSRNSATPPRTFADDEGWEPASLSVSRAATSDDAVKRASGEEPQRPRQERSLLVSPR
jgi:hypothetical protein